MDVCGISCKHPRLLEVPDEQSSFFDDASIKSASQIPQTTDGEDEDNFNKCDIKRRLDSNSLTKDSSDICKFGEAGTSGSISQFWWINSNSISEAADHLSFFPEYFESTHPLKSSPQDDCPEYFESSKPLRSSHQDDEICPPFSDYCHRKTVPVGQAHQAYFSEYSVRSLENSSELVNDSNPLVSSSHASFHGVMVDVNEEKFMGTCVISMPDYEKTFCGDVETITRYECLDSCPTRYVRDNVMEAREKLKESLGPETFKGLGFCEMGEEVASKWTEEEEQSFHEIVISNPASMGKNFWNHLSTVFPSRTHKELVSYYFNVFMLRKRAKQNRVDPLNIDSDDDEWQESALAVIKEDSDSVVESPSYIHTRDYFEDDVEDYDDDTEQEDDIDARRETDGVNMARCHVGTDEEYGEYVDNTIGEHVENCLDTSEGNTYFKILHENRKHNDDEEYFGQDDSCTSYECQNDRVE